MPQHQPPPPDLAYIDPTSATQLTPLIPEDLALSLPPRVTGMLVPVTPMNHLYPRYSFLRGVNWITAGALTNLKATPSADL